MFVQMLNINWDICVYHNKVLFNWETKVAQDWIPVRLKRWAGMCKSVTQGINARCYAHVHGGYTHTHAMAIWAKFNTSPMLSPFWIHYSMCTWWMVAYRTAEGTGKKDALPWQPAPSPPQVIEAVQIGSPSPYEQRWASQHLRGTQFATHCINCS